MRRTRIARQGKKRAGGFKVHAVTGQMWLGGARLLALRVVTVRGEARGDVRSFVAEGHEPSGALCLTPVQLREFRALLENLIAAVEAHKPDAAAEVEATTEPEQEATA